MEVFFRIIIPNYNNKEWLRKCLNSVFDQTFRGYRVTFMDDISRDGSLEEVMEIVKRGNVGITIRACDRKRYNGGTRNSALNIWDIFEPKYILFLDSDDWLCDKNVLKDLHDFIVENNYPDCVRLPYKCRIGEEETTVMLDDDTPEKLVASPFVACWTKCIKTELVQPFPENTLMEDVVQHIKQCDVISNVVPFTRPVVVWNRNNLNSCSREENQDCQRGKWQSSMYRYMADLLDLELEHDYCKQERDKRAKVCLDNIKAGKYIQ